MNTETGRIVTKEQLVKLPKIFQAQSVSIEEAAMTAKQKLEMQVSKFDNRSVLGKLRIKGKNSLRNKPCPCGSGKKFKKCCWHRA
jgi:uncharacterized protein YecA (UPF0149 family)